MTRASPDHRAGGPFGERLLPLLASDLRDRLAGRRNRSIARWGFLSPPSGRGRVLWIAAGVTRDSVLLAVGLAQAVHERRLDVRVVLTYEAEHADLLARVQTLPRVGHGFGACDANSAVRRTLRRFAPLGVIFADVTPRRNLAAALAAQRHVVAVGAGEPLACEVAIPLDAARAAHSGDGAEAVTADLLTLLIEAQAEPVMRAMIAGGERRTYWWLHDDLQQWDVASLIRTLRREMPQAVLFVSGSRAALATPPNAVRLSSWDRAPLAGGTVVLVDAPQWLPGVAAAAQGAHLLASERHPVWQAAALGCPFTLSDGARVNIDSGLAPVGTVADLAASWHALAEDPLRARSAADRVRRRFWEERRRAGAVAEALMQRVFEWD